jgi:sugar phosphate isomerase/epimerase
VIDRRGFLQTVPALAGLTLVGAAASKKRQSGLGVAWTSYAVRLAQGRDLVQGASAGAPGFPAATFIDLCRSLHVDGCQMDLAQLPAKDDRTLTGLRRTLDEAGLFLELSVDGQLLEDADGYAEMAAVAGKLGAVRLRIALLHGRRYETFRRMEDWPEFAGHWRAVLTRAKAAIERAGLAVGIENHKDWRTDELVDLLSSVDSPLVGACVDFGNNLALLEDPLEPARRLAPFAVTTHVKDMAVRLHERGFELSEVPLGTGLLPLAEMVGTLRRARPEVPLVLEMITRDPLLVPCLDDAYWVTYEKRNDARLERFRSSVLSKATKDPLPRISGLTPREMLAAEDDNLRRCVAYARAHLEGLRA